VVSMDKRSLSVVYRSLFGVFAPIAIAVQFIDLAGKGTLNPVNFLSYFTIQSNLIGAAALLIGAVRWRADRSPTLDFVRGGALVYLTVTGLVFALLLSGTDVDTAIPWVNAVVHQVMPIVVLVDWLVDPPASRLTIRQGLLWLSYPLVWITYVFVRGAIVGWYPYPFLNRANGGYSTVATYVVVILVGMALLCALAVTVANAARARRRPWHTAT
jgi:hypothetical protein